MNKEIDELLVKNYQRQEEWRKAHPMNPLILQKLKEFDKRYIVLNSGQLLVRSKFSAVDRDLMNLYPKETIKDVKQFLKTALQEIEKKTLQEAIELSDKIEAEDGTEFNEWRAFKRFRNALRDKLKQEYGL